MGQKKLAILDTHKSVKPVGTTGCIMAEGRGCQFIPLAFQRANPLISIESLAGEIPVRAPEILTKAVQAAQVPTILRGRPTGNQHPLLFVRPKEVSGVSSVGGVFWFRCNEKALFLSGFSGIDQMTMTACAFIAKIAG